MGPQNVRSECPTFLAMSPPENQLNQRTNQYDATALQENQAGR